MLSSTATKNIKHVQLAVLKTFCSLSTISVIKIQVQGNFRC